MHRRRPYALDQLFGKDVSTLAEWIEEIKGDIDARQHLAGDALRDLEHHARATERALEQVAHWAPGYRPSADKRRSDLEHQLERVQREQREHKLSLWRDVEELRKELRLLVREYRRAKRKQELVQGEE